MTAKRRFIEALIASATIWARLPAQSPPERAMLAAWNDSLAHATDATTISRLEPLAKVGPGGAAGDVRKALFLARSALLRHSRGDLELALANLNWISLSKKAWPWPEYAMAVTFAQMERERLPVLASGGQKDGESHVESAWRHLQESFHDDPEFEPARAFVIGVLVAEGDREFRPDEKTVIKRMLVRESPEPDLLLVWGRLLRYQRKYDSALVIFHRSALAGGDPSRIALERARTLRARGETHNASAAYWEGADRLSETGRAAYRYDLAWVMDPDSLLLFDKVPLEKVPDWLHRFWDERDAASVNRPGERLAEHLWRWGYAMDHFRVILPWRHNQFGRIDYLIEGMDPCIGNDSTLYRLLAREQPKYPDDLRGREPILDNRGLIFLHHGAPFRTTTGLGELLDVAAKPLSEEAGRKSEAETLLGDALGGEDAGGCPPPPAPNESWLYWLDGRWRLLHFRPSCALGRFTPSTLVSYLPASFDYYAAMAAILPAYAPAARRMQLWSMGRGMMPLTCYPEVEAIIATSRTDADVAVHTDSDTPPIIRPWNSIVQMFALGHGKEGSGKALLTFALSGPRLSAESTPDGHVVYPVEFRIVAFDRASGQTIALDTVRRFARSEPLKQGQSLAAYFEMPLGSGSWQVAVRANQGDDSSGVYAMKRDLRVDGGNEFSLSDVVMGHIGSPAWTATDGSPFPVNMLGAYAAGATAEMYYEVHGLHAGDAYQTTIVVKAPTPRARDGVRITTTDHASGLVTHVRKSLDLRQLKPGSYRMIVTVTANGRQATREQPLLIANP